MASVYASKHCLSYHCVKIISVIMFVLLPVGGCVRNNIILILDNVLDILSNIFLIILEIIIIDYSIID